MDKAKIWSKTKKIGIVCLWVLMISGVIVSLAFVNRMEDEVKCESVSVKIEPSREIAFIDRETVIRTIREDGDEKKIIGKKLTALNAPGLEEKLNRNKHIRRSEVFTDMNGGVYIHIWQKQPVLHIINAFGRSYYLDNEGFKMPTNTAYTARVPVATGNIFEQYRTDEKPYSYAVNELFKIATYVDKDTFWKAQIEQIFVNAECELVLIPKVGEHTIIFGTTEDMEEKFNKLMLFYKDAIKHVGWGKYKSVNVTYKNQIVCTKK